jgi:hypothetical protein
VQCITSDFLLLPAMCITGAQRSGQNDGQAHHAGAGKVLAQMGRLSLRLGSGLQVGALHVDLLRLSVLMTGELSCAARLLNTYGGPQL